MNKKHLMGALALILVVCLGSVVIVASDDYSDDTTDLTLGSSVSTSSITPTQYSSASISVSGATVTIRVTSSGYSSTIDDIYKINWGDGTSRAELNSANNASKSHTYSSNGTYTVSLTIETWKDGANQLATTSDSFTVTVNSYSTVTNYTVTYNLNGGHIVSGISTSRTVSSGTTITLPGMGDVERDDSYLIGWGLNSVSGTQYSTLSKYTVRSNVTFYALWSAESGSVWTYANGGSFVDSPDFDPNLYRIVGDQGSYVTLLTASDVMRDGYYLKGWNTSKDGTGTSYAAGDRYLISGSSSTLFAIWGVPVVTFDPDEVIDKVDTTSGVVILANNSAEINAGVTIQLPELSGTTISSSGWVQIMTGWRDQAGNAVGFEYTVPTQESITLTPVRSDYFKVDVTQDPIVSVSISNNMSSYLSHVVNWGDGKSDTAGSIVSDSLRHTYEANAAYVITLTSSDFDDSITGSYSIQIAKASSALTTYTVTFASNGGSKIQNQVIVEGNKASEPDNPYRTGYRFAGWFTDAELKTKYDFNMPVNADMTLYAKWYDSSTYTIEFNSNGGSEIAAQKVNVNTNAMKPDDPTKKGYTFAGWYSDAELTSAYDFNMPVNADMTLYAKWDDKAGSGIFSSIPWWIWLIVLIIIIACVIFYVYFK